MCAGLLVLRFDVLLSGPHLAYYLTDSFQTDRVDLIHHVDVRCPIYFAMHQYLGELYPLQIFCNGFLSGPYVGYYLTNRFHTYRVGLLHQVDERVVILQYTY